MLLFSKTLGKDINFTTFEKLDDIGRPIKVIMHDSLQEVIHDAKIKYEFNFISADVKHSVVVCSMADSSGRLIREVGESIPETLDSEIARNYPSLIAMQRAFDRATIRYLDLPGKVFSNLEISTIDGDIPSIDVDEVSTTTPPAPTGVISSIIQDEADISYDVSEEIEVTSEENGAIDNEEELLGYVSSYADTEVVIDDISNSDTLPFDIDTPKEENYGSHVITMSGKYAGKNKTIDEIYATDASWVEWIAKNFVPRNETARKDVTAIKKFINQKKGN